MKTTLFYYSDGIEKHGPFTIEELKEKHITKQTLIWLEGEFEWHPLTSFLSFYEELKPYLNEAAKQQLAIAPPPLPKNAQRKSNPVQRKSNPVIFLYIWTTFHLFALLMSYTGVKFFNVYSDYGQGSEKDQFWPFVKFTEMDGYSGSFKGIFYQYDWTEFALYVGAAWMIYFLFRLSGRKK